MNGFKVFSFMIFMMLLKPIMAQEYSFLEEIAQYREEQNAEFLNPDKSPLTPKERVEFKGHEFFEADEAYRVYARFEATPNDRPFPLGTSKGGTQLYKRIGILHFELKGKPYTLEAYLQVQRFRIPNQKPIVFLPLVDKTTGDTTYGGGRYMHYEGIPEGAEWVIDFNKLYNPYCAYSDKYECPMVPEPNHLPIAIEAGIKGS
ncbi:hypothetical protein BFP97_10155 [Roseivirga sp. 4D4]|uniref:DUF1684 domain-containing protein n=1 Tax=Roseivirga sp. 4D4 TaxID=1889784 RepID=UPI000853D20B|nr:DUF1684 domain-containing protein [Roseivirga sp. 4D4]OEK01854.1 hypothetical protein BFP97_10155 [Roseivirga sp. 4D4]